MSQSATVAGPVHPRPIYKSLYVQVLTAIAIGIALGHFDPVLSPADYARSATSRTISDMILFSSKSLGV